MLQRGQKLGCGDSAKLAVLSPLRHVSAPISHLRSFPPQLVGKPLEPV